MKKLLIIVVCIGLIASLIGALVVLTDKQETEAPTIESHDHYDGAITAKELEESLNNNETVTVYFYDPYCSACQATTPIIFPLSEELGVDLKPYDITTQPFQDYDVQATPTVIHFENGEEVDRVRGNIGRVGFKEFFETHMNQKINGK